MAGLQGHQFESHASTDAAILAALVKTELRRLNLLRLLLKPTG